MKLFVHSREFRNLNLAVMMDEGLAHQEDKFVVYVGERTAARARLSATGPVGHGSKLIENTAFERVSRAMQQLQALRDENVAKLEALDVPRTLSSVTTVNITVMQGGTSNDGGETFAPNVIPSTAFLIADIRIPKEDFAHVTSQIKRISAEYNLELTFENGFDESAGPSPVSDKNSVFAKCLAASLLAFGVPTEMEIFPAATDSRYVRRVGVPAFGFSPMRLTPSLLHDHNECLSRRTYLEGVDVMTAVVRNLASLHPVASSHV
jgi:aminoacylase